MSATRPLRLLALHAELETCKACPGMVGSVVHGPAVDTRVLLVGQAPGPHEASVGRPFGWSAGKTLFRWFLDAMDLDEEHFRKHIYMSAVARCFPGKAKGGGDRKPDRHEIAECSRFLRGEAEILQPELVLAVGGLAMQVVMGEAAAGKNLEQLVGTRQRLRWHGVDTDVIPLPHPSGASPWPRMEPGKTLLAVALGLVREHAAMRPILAEAAARHRR